MTTHYARFNLQLNEPADPANVELWHQHLTDAAIDGMADEFEVFFKDASAVIGLSVPFDAEDPMSLLEAGLVLGYCQRRYEEIGCNGIFRHTWCSLHEADDTQIDSPI